MKIIVTGATGMVGEGILIACLENDLVKEVLSISRKSIQKQHPKLKELIVADFNKLFDYKNEITGYSACFFCAGISSIGMKEDQYRQVTYHTTMAFAKALLATNKDLSFCYISGTGTDSSEHGKLMWARVKGKTENDLMKLPFKAQFNFRPGIMLPYPEQKNWRKSVIVLVKIIRIFATSKVLSLEEVGIAMIEAVSKGAPKQILEIRDIKNLVQQNLVRI